LCQYDGGKNYSSLRVVMNDDVKKFIYKAKEDKKELTVLVGVVVPTKNKNNLFPHKKLGYSGACNFEYSFDKQEIIAFGKPSNHHLGKLSWTRFGIYNYNISRKQVC